MHVSDNSEDRRMRPQRGQPAGSSRPITPLSEMRGPTGVWASTNASRMPSRPLTPSASMPSMMDGSRPDTPEAMHHRHVRGGGATYSMRPSVPGRRMLPDLPGLDTDAGPQKPSRMMDKSVDRLVDLLVDDIADSEVGKAANLPSIAHQSPYLLPVPTPSLISPYDETTRLRREVQRIKAVCERKLVAAEEEKLVALRQQHAEMTAATNEALVAMKQREQDELAEQLFKQAGRRLLSQGLTAGWLCWVQFIESRRYARSRKPHRAGSLEPPPARPASAKPHLGPHPASFQISTPSASPVACRNRCGPTCAHKHDALPGPAEQRAHPLR